MNSAINFISDKQKNSEIEYHNYYKNHYLKSIADLLPKRFGYEASLELLRASKNIKNQRERKKILKSCYHLIDIYQYQTPTYNQYSNTITNIIKNNFMSSRTFFYFLNNYNEDVCEKVSYLINNTPFKFKLTKPNFNIVPDEIYKNKECIQLPFVKEIEKDNQIQIDGKNFYLSPIKDCETVFQRASFYKNCWKQSYIQNTFPYSGFVDIRNKDKELIGTIRFLDIENGNARITCWLSPEIYLNQNSEMGVPLLKKLSRELDKYTNSFSKYNSKNLECVQHYGKQSKYCINTLKTPSKKHFQEVKFF